MDALWYIYIPAERVVGKATSLLVPPGTYLNLYCGYCGEVWANATSENNNTRYKPHDYRHAPCRKCGSGVLYPFFESRYMTHALLLRELELELEVPENLTYGRVFWRHPIATTAPA